MKKILLLIFILLSCGEDDSTSSSIDSFPYGTYQTPCHPDTDREPISSGNNFFNVILSENYNSLEKKFIQTYSIYGGINDCKLPIYKTSSYFSFDKIEYNSDKDLYTIELNFIKTTVTPTSKAIATSFNNMNLSGINTWQENIETDVTGKNPDGSSFTPPSKKYKIISLSNNNTELIQNESDSSYPESLDSEHIFYKQD